ncbi:MAG TPA: threonine-phosphate decarboxylase CobD [Oleiagrimonas sp.]|nr:threonine-phosphate decarboxylase CobD [Oleiagrimonas sp.]
MLEHGGRLLQAAREYGIEPSRWLDLSTGISPFAWPVPSIPARVWQRLPEDEDGLVAVACDYYGAPDLLPVAGSQAAIQTLPKLRAHSRVGVIAPGYAEHAQAWRHEGHDVQMHCAEDLLASAASHDVIVLIHPNNPGGEVFAPSTLLALHAQLAQRGGWLIVDEAFMDASPQHSLCTYAGEPGLVVLRSAGKFFGLAGARAGFVCAWPELLEAMRVWLGPWTVSGPTRHVLRQALADHVWHAQARLRLQEASDRLQRLLSAHGLAPTAGTAFFQWCRTAHAASLQQALATRGILVRHFAQPASLRFGLPADAAEWARLQKALTEIMGEVVA